MTSRNDYKVPEGFLPVLDYLNTQDGEPVVGECRLNIDGEDLFFHIDEKVPVLPLKGYGQIWHKGWDIPTRWAIDGSKQCWIDNAHGDCLYPVEDYILLGTSENDSERGDIRSCLDLEPEEPEWMKKAKAAGWQPPK